MSVLAVFVSACLSSAVDTVKISSLLVELIGYTMKLIRIEGTVVDFQMQHFIGSMRIHYE